ncbi:ATP-binding protein [Jiella pelagia]|uniref:histidine kinase n=1 Tax=Jiella pelagia TaxID=2986949 RepID=A0ABY7BX51_9HYPH|nr:ATP-binding protein [Jiella pelagia]WAP67973.1 ATP-binding protein [Jiella pelagia]
MGTDLKALLLSRSLTARVIFLTSLWAVAALFVVGALISTLYERTAREGFENLLGAQLYNLVNAVSVDGSGSLQGNPDLGDLRYARPLSGWYWEVLPATDNTSGRLTSASLVLLTVPQAPVSNVPFDQMYRRTYEEHGLNGETLKVLETEVVLDSQNHTARFRVMGSLSSVLDDIGTFDRTLVFYLGLVGLGTVLVNVFVIIFALRPLQRVRVSLTDVREGRAERLQTGFPAEIEPLAVEMNALIDNNRRIVERSRTQVGNLAHSLKTPIAILVNEAANIDAEKGRVVAEQAARMRGQVQHYLDRARMAAQSQSIVFRTPAREVLERVARVIAKLNPRLDVEFEGAETGDLIFAGERQDLEEVVGNLLDNAGKWAESRIRLSCRVEGADRLAVTVEDDGPGLSTEEIREALKRGRRLDEATPGSGLGLSIVRDIVGEYRGTLELGASDLGGLSAKVVLPRIR